MPSPLHTPAALRRVWDHLPYGLDHLPGWDVGRAEKPLTGCIALLTAALATLKFSILELIAEQTLLKIPLHVLISFSVDCILQSSINSAGMIHESGHYLWMFLCQQILLAAGVAPSSTCRGSLSLYVGCAVCFASKLTYILATHYQRYSTPQCIIFEVFTLQRAWRLPTMQQT